MENIYIFKRNSASVHVIPRLEGASYTLDADEIIITTSNLSEAIGKVLQLNILILKDKDNLAVGEPLFGLVCFTE